MRRSLLSLLGVSLCGLLIACGGVSFLPGSGTSKRHTSPPKQPFVYPNATNIALALEPYESHRTRFDITDSSDDVLCFYEQELRRQGWSAFDDENHYNEEQQTKERDYEKSRGTVIPLKCPDAYFYVHDTGRKLGDMYTFYVRSKSEDGVLHVETEFINQHQGLR